MIFTFQHFRMLRQTTLIVVFVVLATLALDIHAGVARRSEQDERVDTDVDVARVQNGNAASIVNVVLPKPSRTCRRCICTITEVCPNVPERTCLSAASLCCCCATRSFLCQGRDGMLQPDTDFVDSVSEIGIGTDVA